MKRIVGNVIMMSALACLISGPIARADSITMDIPELVGTFTHGQEPVHVSIDFGTDFQPLWGISLQITATGTAGFGTYGPDPAELLVSAYGDFQWMSPSIFGPYGETPTTDSQSEGYMWVAIYPPPITGGRAVITIDTPASGQGAWMPAEVQITSAIITAEYSPLLYGGGADINEDGFVGLADLDIVLTHWNQFTFPGNKYAGDLTGDGYVGLMDLDVILNRWNSGAPPAMAPEPTGLWLMAAMSYLAWRRRG